MTSDGSASNTTRPHAVDADLARFSRIFANDPDTVPVELWPRLAESVPPAGYDAETWNDEVVRFLRSPWATIVPQALDRVVRLAEAAIGATPTDDPNHPGYTSNLVTALRLRFQLVGDRNDIDRAIAVGQHASDAAPLDDSDRPGYLSNLGAAFQTRYQAFGDPDDLDRAVAIGQEAVDTSPPTASGLAGYLCNLTSALTNRFNCSRDRTDLDRAVAAGQRSVDLMPLDDPGRADVLSNLTMALMTRFQTTDDVADADRAVEAAERAVHACPAGHPDRGKWLSNLSAILRQRFERTGAAADAEQAVAAGRESVEATPPGHPDHVAMGVNLALALEVRAEHTGQPSYLDEGITYQQQAVAATPADHPQRAGWLSDLGIALYQRFEHVGDLSDLDTAVLRLRQSVAATTPGYPRRARIVLNLGAVLHARFEQTGARADLDEAIEFLRQSVVAAADDPGLPGHLTDLGAALYSRFERYRALADADDAIAVLHKAVDAAPTDHHLRAGLLVNLGAARIGRFEDTGDLRDLDEAVVVTERAVAASRSNPSTRRRALSGLCIALQDRFEQTGAIQDLDRAVLIGEQAVEASSAADPERDRWLSNLCGALLMRFNRAGAVEDLAQAAEIGRRALEATAADHPRRAQHLYNLVSVQLARAQLTGDDRDRLTALALAREAATMTTAAPQTRIWAAKRWADLAEALADQAQAAEAWDVALDLLPLLVGHGLDRKDRRRLLAQLSGFGSGAAAFELGRGLPNRAWQALEQGRGVLFSQALQIRPDTTELAQDHPTLAAEIDRIRGLLATTDGQSPSTHLGYVDPVRRRQRAAEEWEQLLTTIRAKDGYAEFGRPVEASRLADIAADGPIVAVNINTDRCDALILTTHGSDIVHLKGLTMAEVAIRGNAFLASVKAAKLREPRDATPVHVAFDSTKIVDDTLAWLWDVVAGPVLDCLGHTSPPADNAWPRLWWMPTGPLSVLPIHAAGHRGNGHERVLDRVISSYTPTLRALDHARHRHVSPMTGSVIVGLNHVPGQPSLQYARDEATAVATLLRSPAGPLLDDTATYDAVVAQLPAARWAHFACHGVATPDPDQSHLQLYDRPLPVHALTNLNLSGAYLAYLSACGTAFGGVELLEESIHLASAFHLAGFQHVIATLWPINDSVAPEIATHFYEMLNIGIGPAAALHHAVRRTKRIQHNPSLWASYIHMGS